MITRSVHFPNINNTLPIVTYLRLDIPALGQELLSQGAGLTSRVEGLSHLFDRSQEGIHQFSQEMTDLGLRRWNLF